MTSTSMNHQWQAEDYHQNSSVQSKAAADLLRALCLKGTEHVLDVGCGDGKITVTIAASLPKGSIIGIDNSPDMIKFARELFPHSHYSNLTFLLQDASEFNHSNRFDIVFSSFALQWLPVPDLFFERVYHGLKPSGYMAVTVPLGISLELEKAIAATTSTKEWSKYFEDFSPTWHFCTERKYRESLTKYPFDLIQFSAIYQTEIFPSKLDFKNYIITWFTYLHAVPEHLREAFMTEIIDKYLEMVPLEDERVRFGFQRLDFIVQKPTL